MPTVLRLRVVQVWALLVVLTCASFWAGAGHGLGTTRAALSTVLVVAFAKVWLVGRFFMDLRRAPPLLRRAVDAWLFTTGGAILVMYLTL